MERGERWYPTTYEIAEIMSELKPLIAEIARRDRVRLVHEMVKAGPGVA